LWFRLRKAGLCLKNLIDHFIPELLIFLNVIGKQFFGISPAFWTYFLANPQKIGVLGTRVIQHRAFGAMLLLRLKFPQANPAYSFYLSNDHVWPKVSMAPAQAVMLSGVEEVFA
jgi:hypothetical protein